MKTITFNILFLTIIFNCNSQIISLTNADFQNIPDGAYVKDIDGKLNPYIGTWQYTDSNIEFTVVLVKKERYDRGGFNSTERDIILGGYKLVENGNVIVDLLNFTTDYVFSDPSTTTNYARIIGGVKKEGGFDSMSFNTTDVIYSKGAHGRFELINPLINSQGNFVANSAHWKLIPRENIIINGNRPIPSDGFSIPSDVILTKIE